MSIEEDTAVLENVPLLRVLGRGILRLIAMGAESREVMTGEMLFAPNERIDCAYLIQQGSFQLTVDPVGSERATEAGPGMLLGEYALLSETARPLTAIAQEPSMVLRISRSMFMKILGDDADAAVRLRDFIARRSRQTTADMLLVRNALDPERDR